MKLIVAPCDRLRLANVRSIELYVLPPMFAVRTLEPLETVKAPMVSVAATEARPVTAIEPAFIVMAIASPIRLLFWVRREVLFESVRVPLLMTMPLELRIVASFSSVTFVCMIVVFPV